jgi:predicted transcriptional regulator
MLSKTEYDLLSYMAARGPLTVRQLTQSFGEERGYSRGTITQMVDRLMKKGRLRRETVDFVFAYSSVHSLDELSSEAVAGFVDERLGGSVQPLVAYFLSQSEDLTPDERETLRALVEALEQRKEG